MHRSPCIGITCLLLLCVLAIFGLESPAAASPNIVWQKCLGGSSDDFASSVEQTADGGYIVAGYTSSNDGDVTSGGYHGGADYWVAKLNDAGRITWQRCLGGSSNDYASSAEQTADGGYIVAGYTFSNDGNVTNGGYHGGGDYWVVKLNGAGGITWQKCLGGSHADIPRYVEQTADGGYIVAGVTSSNDGDVTKGGYHSRDDYWVAKLNGAGRITWQRCLGGSSDDLASTVEQTADGGYIVAGGTSSNDGDVTNGGYHGANDYWVVKLKETGRA